MRLKIFLFVVIFSVTVPVLSYALAAYPQAVIRANDSSGYIDVDYNEQVSIKWESTDSTGCMKIVTDADGKIIEQQYTTPNSEGGDNGRFTSSRKYAIECRNINGQVARDSVTINVRPSLKNMVVDIKANGVDTDNTDPKGITVSAGSTVKLSWRSENVSSCTLTSYDEKGQSIGSKRVLTEGSSSGSLKVSRAFVLSCLGSGGVSKSDMIRVRIGQATATNPITCTAINGTLKVGAKDAEVTLLQRFLYEKGYLSVVPTGYFGEGTVLALKKFQKAAGLQQTGSATDETRARIKKLSCK